MSQFDRQNIQNNPEKAPAVRQAGEHLGFGFIECELKSSRVQYALRGRSHYNAKHQMLPVLDLLYCEFLRCSHAL